MNTPLSTHEDPILTATRCLPDNTTDSQLTP